MKIPVLIRIVFAVILGLTGEVTLLAETVVLGDGGLTNLVVNVPAGKIMIVRASSLRDAENTVSINSGGVTFQPNMDAGFDTRFQPRYLAGPCTFAWSSEFVMNNSIFNYDVIPTDGIQTLVGTNSSTIQVPSGKRLRVLDGSYPVWLTVTLTNGASATVGITPKQSNMSNFETCNPEGFELAGPVAVAVSGQDLNPAPFFMTYFFASDVVQALGGSIQVPAGSVVTVEKSSDLQTWYPAFTATERSAPKSFYRLKVTR